MTDKESVLPLEPEQQRKFDTVLRALNALVSPESILGAADKNVTRLVLRRALPDHISLAALLFKLEGLQVLDLSDNKLGPEGVRTLCMALPSTAPVLSLNIADNKMDTDTAESIGRLLTQGPPLVYLDVSGNYLGKDYFSRCVGQALKDNTTLHTLRAQSIGMVDATVLLEGLQENSTLVELDLSNNQITDRKMLGSGMAAILMKAECHLQSLALSGCNMDASGLQLLSEGLGKNSSLQALNLNNNEFGSLQTLMDLVSTAVSHGNLRNLHVNDARIKDTCVSDVPKSTTQNPSSLQVLSANSSNINDEFFQLLCKTFRGRLPSLVDVDVSNNDKITAVVAEHLLGLTADSNGRSSIRKLTAAMNDMNGLAAQLKPDKFPYLSYLNVRKARFSPDEFSALAGLVAPARLPLTTLVLDGMKLSGKKGLATLFDSCPSSQITALSLSGCFLTDADVTALWQAVRSGFQLQMLKLSANRLTGVALRSLAESLLSVALHPLSVLDVSDNQIADVGVQELCKVYSDKKHTSSIHSLNLTTNAIGKVGILSLISCIGSKSPLKCLYISNQTASFLESDVDEINHKLASVLGYTIQKSGETIKRGCSSLPPLPEGFTIQMRGLGGYSGELGPVLDCPAILTDSSSKFMFTLTLQNVFDICGSLQGHENGKCVLSAEDWNYIIGANKDNTIPSWLQLADSRAKGVYLSNLPGNSTSQRLEALFETEADCNIDEVVLVKDPVSKNNSGTAWVLFSDEASVDRAVALYRRGEAQVFGTPFTISRIQVTVEETAKQLDSSAKARQDMAARQKARAAEDHAHRLLIQQNTEESWKRHAYRLAHPAYADGRVW